MATTETPARERILEATVQLIKQGHDVDSLTVRHIAEEAGVAVGAVNYHFGSKGDLLVEAVGQLIGAEANRWLQPDLNADPMARLRQVFKGTARVAAAYRSFGSLLIRHAMLGSDFVSQHMVLPLLREIVGPGPSEQELRLLAYQLITPMQDAFVRPDAFYAYSGIDVFDETQRDRAIDALIDNLLGGRYAAQTHDSDG